MRSQFLGEEYRFTVEALLNPLLYTSELSALPLLLNEYSMWSWNAEDSGFIGLNQELENLFGKYLKSHPVTPLKNEVEPEDRSTEIHDELGGLFRTQIFLGLAYDSKTQLMEKFSWFENPANLELLFNTTKHAAKLAETRSQSGFGAWWRERGELKRLTRVLDEFSKLLRTNKVLGQLLATHYMRRSLNSAIL